MTSAPQIRVDGRWLSSLGWWGEPAVTHRWPGGCFRLDWEMALQAWDRPEQLRRGARVEVYCGAASVWAGALAQPDWSDGTFFAEGAFREAEGVLALDGSGATTSIPDTAIDAAITTGLLTWTRPTSVSAAAVGETSDGATDQLNYLDDLLDTWAAQSGLRWWVDPDRVLRTAHDITVPQWHVMPDSGVLGVAADDYATDLVGRYLRTSGGYASATVSDQTQGVGRVQHAIDLTNWGPIDAPKAATILTGILNQYRARTGWANGITVTSSQVTTLGGVQADLSQVRAGQMARCLGLRDPRTGSPYTDVILGETVWRATPDTIDLNPVGLAARDLASIVEAAGGVLS